MTEVDDWEKLMPQQSRRFPTLHEAIEVALYARPSEFSLFRGFVLAFVFVVIVPFGVLGLYGIYLLYTGQVTVGELIAVWQAASAPSAAPTLKELLIQLIQFPIVISIALGVTVYVKVCIKLFRRV